jgi:small subunit ribosomal protein S9
MADTPEQPGTEPGAHAAEGGGSHDHERQEGVVEETEPRPEAAGEEQAEAPAAEQQPAAEEQPAAEQQPAAAEQPAAQEQPAAAEQPAAEEQPAVQAEASADEGDDADEADEEPALRERPAIPGMDLEVDIVGEGADPLAGGEEDDEDGAPSDEDADTPDDQPIAAVTIDLAAGARYGATGKRKTAVARVILKPGTGVYTINGRDLDAFFPRTTLERTIRQPLETVGYESRMDVVARMHGGGVSSQAGALRHGISRALLEADPNLRGELKRRGFLTRDARAKERKKAGLKKARKRPQFSKR